MAGLAAGASSEDVRHLYEFGRNIGLAFQLQDDILDTYGEAVVVGKQIGGDIVQNKKTYLILKAQELASDPDRSTLATLMSTPTIDPKSKINAVKALLDKLNIRHQAQETKEQYQNEAFAHLSALSIPPANRVALESLAHALLDRISWFERFFRKKTNSWNFVNKISSLNIDSIESIYNSFTFIFYVNY